MSGNFLKEKEESYQRLAEDLGFRLFQKLTEAEAAGLIGVSLMTLRRIRSRGEISYLKTSERRIYYFGQHIAEYLLDCEEVKSCPENNNESSKSENFGFPNNPKPQTGATTIMTNERDKQSVVASAQKILSKQKRS